MTREEAIKILRDTPIDIRSMREDDIHTLYATAQGMAIDALQAEPVKHGEWEEKETHLNEGDCEITEWQSARCSKCGKYHTTPYMYSFNNFNFCPNCGAKMDKEIEDNGTE